MAAKKTVKKTAGKKAKAPVKKTPKNAAAKAAVTPRVKKAASAKGKAAAFHLYDEGGKKFVPAEKAKAVKAPGFDDFQFFLHKSADGNRSAGGAKVASGTSPKGGDQEGSRKGWTISEATSGGRISVGRTQKEAKEKAAEALGKHGKDDLAESIKRSISKNGTAPGFEDAAKGTAKKTFSVTTDDGTEVEVTFDAEFRNHLEFRGEISPTGYRSHFGYDGKGRPRTPPGRLPTTCAPSS